MTEWRWNGEIGHPELRPSGMCPMRIIADIKRYGASPAGKIERLLRVHRQHSDVAAFENIQRIIIGGLPKLAVTNDDIVGRSNSFRPIASLNLRRRPSIVQA